MASSDELAATELAAAELAANNLLENLELNVKEKRESDIPQEADNDSGVDETTQAKVETKKNVPTTLKGIPRKQQVITSPTKRLPSPTKTLTSPVKQMASARTPLSPSGMKFNGKTPTLETKKLPMNKIVVGQAASPNLKQVKSKIGSMANMTHRPGGGAVRVETKQLNFSQAKSKVGALNANYKPGGGDKKIESKKLEWNAKSKVGSLDNTKHKPGGGEKKIETVKLDFKDKAQSKVGSVANLKHQPGGGKLQSPPQCMSPGLPQNGLTPTSIEDSAKIRDYNR
uniref:Microtubule-associated protein n=1 Tax=Strigamia maritima TaxID=126957 RepID=T1JI61_STRMM